MPSFQSLWALYTTQRHNYNRINYMCPESHTKQHMTLPTALSPKKIIRFSMSFGMPSGWEPYTSLRGSCSKEQGLWHKRYTPGFLLDGIIQLKGFEKYSFCWLRNRSTQTTRPYAMKGFIGSNQTLNCTRSQLVTTAAFRGSGVTQAYHVISITACADAI